MKHIRKALSLVLAVALLFSMVAFTAPSARADVGVKARHGAFAAAALGRIYMILPTENGASLYSMPEDGGTVTHLEAAPQINDLVAAPNGNVYYLRYTGQAFQAVLRGADGASTVLATFDAGQLAYALSYYDGDLFCLVDNRLTRISSAGAGAQTVSARQIGSYTIADGIVYYSALEDKVTYNKPHTQASGTQVTVTSDAGALYAMNVDGTSDMKQFDQGVSNLAAYGEYVYFHNFNDSYVVDGSPEAWLDGKLYRLNVQTNQFRLLREGYDWNYRPVDLGLVIYQERSLTIAAQDGTDPALLYAPDPYNYMALLDNYAIIYEYNLAQPKLTRVPYDQSGSVQLWSGPFVTDGSTGEIINQTTALTTTGTAQTGEQTGTTTTTGTTTGTTTTTTGTTTTGDNAGYTQPTVPPTTGTTGTTSNGSLVYGATGEQVRQMQTRLKELGYLGYVDGVFGEKTLTAVKRFQRAAGLTVDGIAGKKTLAKLNSSDAPKYDGSSSGTDSSYIFPDSSTKKLTREEVLKINKSLWPYARNEIYARHGYEFQESKYRNYFENKTWYKKGGFSTKDLNATEWYNMELIRDMEAEFADKSTGESGGSGGTPSISGDYIFPNSSTKKLTKDEIRAVNKNLWAYGRNEIYARHGYKFTKTEFKNYFEGKSWYKAGGFSTKDLNDIEWYNMDLIRWMEENEG